MNIKDTDEYYKYLSYSGESLSDAKKRIKGYRDKRAKKLALINKKVYN